MQGYRKEDVLSGEPKETVLDLRGLRCPYPVLKAGKAMRALGVGDVLVIECTDPLSRLDIPHFAAQAGHGLVEQAERDGIIVFRLVKGAGATAAET